MKRLILLALVIGIGVLGNPKLHAQQSPQQTSLPNAVKTQPTPNRFTAKLFGEVIWKGQDLSQTNVSVYRDEKLRDLYTSGLSRTGTGAFELRVEPGRYYLVAYVDVDASGKFDEGDGYGVLGIKDWQDETQKHVAVDIGANAELKGIQIPITARLQRIGDKQKLVATSIYQPSEYRRFKTELSRATSGCRGMLKYTKESVFSEVPMLILAYTDTSWKYRAGIAPVDAKTGQWELRLKPGKYYLMAIIDKNSSNKLDAGDTFGFYGVIDMYKRGAFPEPILIKSNTFTENLEIQISATYKTKHQSKNQENTAIISGRVTPIPQTETEVRVEVYPTSALVNPIASATTDSEGKFRFQLPPGEYYLIANHDADGDGRYSEGDTLGALGTDSIATTPPPAVVFDAGVTRAANIQMSARYDVEGQLVTLENNLLTGNLAVNASADAVPEEQVGSITGKITSFFASRTIKKESEEPISENQELVPDGILSLSTTPDFSSPTWMPLFLDEEGRYLIDVEPGQYYIMAVVDQNSDGRSGTADGIGIFGTHQPVRGTPAAVTVFPGKITPHVDIDILASYVDEEGTMAELSDGGRWNIARRFGEPEDIFKYTQNGKMIEEWMYWSRGIGFNFEADGAGWKLKDQNKFEPKTQNIPKETETPEEDKQDNENKPKTEQPASVSLDGFSIAAESVFIYYSHEGVLWRIAPADTIDVAANVHRDVPLDTRVAPLGTGFRPSASENGTLVFHDFDDNVIIRNIAIGKNMILLDNRHLAEDVAISPNGEYIAYAQTEPSRRKRIVIQNIRSEKIFRIPSTAVEMSNPAWRPDGELLAYATAGSIENPKSSENRNIYAFDNMANSVEPIVISPADDAEPAWHPADRNRLAFSRGVDGNPRQIWIVTFDANGKPTEQQITEMGGSRPVWVPPNGRWILYENNGQLWTVDMKIPGSESPLMSNGKAVFGYQPIAVAVE
jgi:uncharacterized protein (DUF2141 family)